MKNPGNKNEQGAVIMAVEKQLMQYPSSTLKDIYKSFFQDEFGPGHLLTDIVSARRYFDHELSIMKSRGRYKDEPCGMGKNFVRAGMDKVLDGLVSPDEFFNAFLESSAGFKLPDVQEWRTQWNSVLKEIVPLRNRIRDFDKDAAELTELLERGEYVAHHSEIYVREYDPHYRIMRVDYRILTLRN